MDNTTRRLQIATLALELVFDYLPHGLKVPIALMLDEVFEEWDAGTAQALGLQAGQGEPLGSMPGVQGRAHEEGPAPAVEGDAKLVDVFSLPEGR